MTSTEEKDTTTTTHLGTSNGITNSNNSEIPPNDEPAFIGDTIEEVDESFCMVVAGLLDLS